MIFTCIIILTLWSEVMTQFPSTADNIISIFDTMTVTSSNSLSSFVRARYTSRTQHVTHNNILKVKKSVIPPDYYELFENGAFKCYNHSATWLKARKTCEDDGAQLAYFRSEDERAFLLSVVRNKTGLWVGVYERFDKVVTMDNEIIAIVSIILNGRDLCFYLKPDSILGREKCNDRELPFCCEVSSAA